MLGFYAFIKGFRGLIQLVIHYCFVSSISLDNSRLFLRGHSGMVSGYKKKGVADRVTNPEGRLVQGWRRAG